MAPLSPQPGPDFVWICVAYITLRNGSRLYARDVGKKAFCFWAKPR